MKILLFLLWASPILGQSLSGNQGALRSAYQVAKEHDYTFLRNGPQVMRFVEHGYLVPIPGNETYRVKRVSYPYARPEVKLFLERLSKQYYAACGEKLVVTSLTRPLNRQPRNASRLSVHPTGMAMDLRLSAKRSCRAWLERVLLSLEAQGVLDGIRERYPPHYHVSLFPRQYARYVAALQRRLQGG